AGALRPAPEPETADRQASQASQGTADLGSEATAASTLAAAPRRQPAARRRQPPEPPPVACAAKAPLFEDARAQFFAAASLLPLGQQEAPRSQVEGTAHDRPPVRQPAAVAWRQR